MAGTMVGGDFVIVRVMAKKSNSESHTLPENIENGWKDYSWA